MKKTFILCAGLLLLAFCSCTSDDYASAASEQQEQKVTVAQLKEQLLKMSPHPEGYKVAASRSGARLNLWDWIKVAVADASGAIKGAKENEEGLRIYGAIVGAIVASETKIQQILDDKNAKIQAQSTNCLTVCTPNRNMAVEDSVGYYHNLVEWELHSMNENGPHLSMMTLVQKTDSIVRTKLPEYNISIPHLPFMDRMDFAMTATRIRNINNDQPFFDYCDDLMNAFPDYADCIDFVAQYLFDLAYANEDPEEYTTDVINMIDLSNMDYDEYISLRRGVLVAYSSYLYSSSASYVSINE